MIDIGDDAAKPSQGTETPKADDSNAEDEVSEQVTAITVKDIATVVDTKPASALLTPAFAELGNYFGERAAEWVAAKRRKREKNLQAHVRVVMERSKPLIDDSGPTERQAEEAAAWAQGAQTVDPTKDAELSALWQGLLSSIYADDDDVKELQVALQKMNSSDARMLLSFEPRWQRLDLDEPSTMKLVGLQLVSRARLSDLATPPSVACASVILASIITFFLIPDFLQPLMTYDGNLSSYSSMQIQLYRTAILLLSVFAVVLGGYWAARRLGSFRITRMGRRLQSSGRRFLSSR